MGYSELCNAVILNAVKDYERMLSLCKRLHITNPSEWYVEHYHKDDTREGNGSETKPATIIKWGLDARSFLMDEKRCNLYTNLDGPRIVKHCEKKIGFVPELRT